MKQSAFADTEQRFALFTSMLQNTSLFLLVFMPMQTPKVLMSSLPRYLQDDVLIAML
jgi:hypothetical protein